MKLKKLLTYILPSLLTLTATQTFASGTDATAKRLGPVSYYGALHTSGGKIIGAKNNEEAVLRGMSLFWSDATGLPYYDKTVISWAVENLKMDVFRFAMGITYYKENTANPLDESYSYAGAPDGYKLILDKMVEAAVENDVYIIIDWHSHRADSEQAIATSFFKEVAAKYKDVPNVIFEIFNEPVHQSWSQITSYANAVIPGIRQSTQNLVLVGTPNWSQMTQYGGVSGTNIGYVLHFYAGSHSVGTYGNRATAAKSSGNPVFITEWGTVNADGKGSANASATNEWFTFMDQNNISNCNWSLRTTQSAYDSETETSAMFEGKETLTTKAKLDAATFSESGKIVKDYLVKHARDWNELVTSGKRSGQCAFAHSTATEVDGQISNVLKSGCSYTSSDEKVVSVQGQNLIINGYGYAILTGNDGTQSVVTITSMPKQTINNLVDLSCNNLGSCSLSRTLDFSGSGKNEWVFSINATTNEGSPFTIKSSDPSVVTVKTATCSSTSCSSAQKNKQVVMYEFKKFGTAQITVTAPAISGYQALNETVTVSYNKGPNKLTQNFKNLKLAFGETTTKLLPDTTVYHSRPVTYTFNGKPTSQYLTVTPNSPTGDEKFPIGNLVTAGNQNAIVKITAHVDETDLYKELNKSITVIIGDSSQAVNKEEYYGTPEPSAIITKPIQLALTATINNNMLNIGCKNAGQINVDVFSITGQKVMNKQLSSANATMSLANMPNGSYLIVITQDAKQLNVKWNKK